MTHFVKASLWVSEGGEVRRPQKKVLWWCLQCREWEGMTWLTVRPSEFQGTFRGQPSMCGASPVGMCLPSAGAPLLTPFLVRKDLPHRTAILRKLYLAGAKISCISLIRLQETWPCLSTEERKGWRVPLLTVRRPICWSELSVHAKFIFLWGSIPVWLTESNTRLKRSSLSTRTSKDFSGTVPREIKDLKSHKALRDYKNSK